MTHRITLPLLLALCALPALAAGQSADNVALVINTASDASQRIGEHYLRARAIPADQVIRIDTAAEDTIERTAYVRQIEAPIAAAIRRRGLQDRILYIVLTKGVPLRIGGTTGTDGTVASVDSELTLLYRRMTGQSAPIGGRVANPYFLDQTPLAEAKRFSHRTHDIYLVTRLDAFTVEDAIGLIDRARSPVREGKIVLDQRAVLLADAIGDRWLGDAAARLAAAGAGDRVVLEETSRGARGVAGVLGYYSWGSNDAANRVRKVEMGFVPGSLAATFVSSDGRTFEKPPDGWMPTGNWNDRRAWFAGSPQSLVGDLIREGATGVAGHVAEPYLQSTVRPDILFPAYLAGFNLVEAFYLALPHLSWQTVVVGDPLCAPFARPPLQPSDLEAPIDAATQLPGFFAKRRLDVARAATKDVPAPAIALAVAAETRQDRGDDRGAAQAFEEAATLAPSFTAAHLALALLHEKAGNRDSAVQRYRTILKYQPNHLTALNNLAFNLGQSAGDRAEALQLAQRAAAVAPGNVTVQDTLGWIEHLAGRQEDAAKRFAAIARVAGLSAEIRLHAAVVFAAVGSLKEAQSQLAEALKISPELAARDEVAQLRQRLQSR
jgi:uncharacterized protein (TIGR03790 family)